MRAAGRWRKAGLWRGFETWAGVVRDARAKEAEMAGRASELVVVKGEHPKALRSAHQIAEQRELEKRELQDVVDKTQAQADWEARRRAETCGRVVERMLRRELETAFDEFVGRTQASRAGREKLMGSKQVVSRWGRQLTLAAVDWWHQSPSARSSARPRLVLAPRTHTKAYDAPCLMRRVAQIPPSMLRHLAAVR